MNAPSVKTLRERLDLDETTARAIRRIMKWNPPLGVRAHHVANAFVEWLSDADVSAGAVDAANQRVRECYHPPNWTDVALHAIDAILGTYGIEGMAHPDNFRCGFSYCNTGETYNPTVLLATWSEGDQWYVCSWGDFVERHPVYLRDR